jgi:glycosyltransferase involved in cell wall biosynthesis
VSGAPAEISSRDPLVSLAMAAWKPRRDWLLEAVSTALGQTGCRIEVLVVDDGSPEPVADLLADVPDPRLRVHRIEHGGEAAARNAGAAEARGDWIRYIDADDAYPPGGTARLLGLTGGDTGLITYGATRFCDEDLRPVWTMTADAEGDAQLDCLLGRFAARPQAFLFPRRIVEAVGPWDPGFRVSHDWDYILRALEIAPVRGTQEVVTLYRKHGSAATTDTEAGRAGARRVVDRWLERHPEQRGGRLERRAEAMLAAHSARTALTHGRPREAVGELVRAARLDRRAIRTELVGALPALRAKLGGPPG